MKADVRDALSAFHAVRSAHPQRAMIRYFGISLSFADVDADSDAFAAALRAQGFQAGDRLGIVAQNIPQFVIVVLAVWKLHGIAVLANPALPDDDLTALLRRTRVKIVACEESRLARWSTSTSVPAPIVSLCPHQYDPELAPPLVPAHEPATDDRLDFAEVISRHRNAHVEHAVVDPTSVAAIVFTSGTTSEPKSALVRHESLAFVGDVYRDWMSLTGRDVIMCVAPLTTILGIAAGLLISLVAGSSLSLSYRFDAATFAETVRAHHGTFVIAAPTIYARLLERSMADDGDLASLRHVYCGGSTVSPALVHRWQARFGHRMGTAYGMTETSGPTHLSPVAADIPIDPVSGAIAVGRAVPGTEFRIIDPNGSVQDELEDGRPGELVVRGPQTITRYGDHESNPAITEDGWIRTGDLATRHDGWVFVTDRIKNIIISSGYNVSPSKVEEVLRAHPRVADAAVVGVPESIRGEVVHAFVVGVGGARLKSQELTDFCRERLPVFARPRSIEFVDALAMNFAGKVMHRSLHPQSPVTP